MLSNEDASYVIRQIRNIDWYIARITEIENKLSKVSDLLNYDRGYKSPLNWQRITIKVKDWEGKLVDEDARYKAPGSKYQSNSNGLVFDYEDELIQELQVTRYSLCKAMSYLEQLKQSDEVQFILDYFDNKSYESLKMQYHISNVNRHMKSLVKRQIKQI
ncbi:MULTISPECIES: hypothetical protein [unclassified Holdemanella]|uniref:hypothetical protein n=1 Tax=unclassified Holdemanella TaxID=2633909 RepID=UPI001D0B2D9A|nr:MULTISPECIES: hypothetical protein [unclassified Holdemanella]MCB8641976.1 hypothetical protein [Holdemanella sp. DFI.5.55]MCG5650325.1 hypothetical protein [Holdemanella sp. DFI.5.21]